MYFAKGVVIVVYHFRLIKKAAAPNELKVKVGSESKEFVSAILFVVGKVAALQNHILFW